jgi:hypothetical protein
MSDKRQKTQLELAFAGESRSEAPMTRAEGTESFKAERETESPAIAERLMEEVCERGNCEQALKRVQSNKGSAGVDGMTIQQLPAYLKKHWPKIREQLLAGIYKPQPVLRVEIAKPDGGMRKLGIPTVISQCTSAGSVSGCFTIPDSAGVEHPVPESLFVGCVEGNPIGHSAVQAPSREQAALDPIIDDAIGHSETFGGLADG